MYLREMNGGWEVGEREEEGGGGGWWGGIFSLVWTTEVVRCPGHEGEPQLNQGAEGGSFHDVHTREAQLSLIPLYILASVWVASRWNTEDWY